MRSLFLFLGVFLCHGLAHAAEENEAGARPAWIDGETVAKFPELRFLTAVGSGTSRGAAEADAKKQLASVFRAKVSSETKSESKSSVSEDTDAKTTGSASGSLQSNVNIQTMVELRHVEIKSHYQDPQTNEHFALAVMDKLKAKNSYSMELANLKSKILSLHERYLEKPDVATANEILELSEKYEVVNAEHQVVGGAKGLGNPLSYQQLDKIRAGMTDLKTSTAIVLEFSGEEAMPEFQELITSCLSEKGVAVLAKLEDGKRPDYHVQYNMAEKQKFMDVKGWVKFQFSSLAVVKRGNVLIDRKRVSREATGRDKENAFDSIKEDLSEQVCDQIAKTVARK